MAKDFFVLWVGEKILPYDVVHVRETLAKVLLQKFWTNMANRNSHWLESFHLEKALLQIAGRLEFLQKFQNFWTLFEIQFITIDDTFEIRIKSIYRARSV